MAQIKFVIPFLLSSLFSEEKTRVEWLVSMIHEQGRQRSGQGFGR